MVVGVLSILSHAIPTLWLNRLDVAAAILAIAHMALPALTYRTYPLLESKGQSHLITPEMLAELKQSGFKALVSLGKTLASWKNEVARMWRFSKI